MNKLILENTAPVIYINVEKRKIRRKIETKECKTNRSLCILSVGIRILISIIIQILY